MYRISMYMLCAQEEMWSSTVMRRGTGAGRGGGSRGGGAGTTGGASAGTGEGS